MILVTVGTEQYPFNRLMHWVEVLLQSEMIQEEVVVQYGNSTVLPAGAKVYQFLKEEKFQDLINEARIVIAHCGEGTLLLLDSLDKPVDDHQVELGLALSQINVPVAWCPGDLARFIDAPRKVSVADVSQTNATALCNSLQSRFGQTLN